MLRRAFRLFTDLCFFSPSPLLAYSAARDESSAAADDGRAAVDDARHGADAVQHADDAADRGAEPAGSQTGPVRGPVKQVIRGNERNLNADCLRPPCLEGSNAAVTLSFHFRYAAKLA